MTLNKFEQSKAGRLFSRAIGILRREGFVSMTSGTVKYIVGYHICPFLSRIYVKHGFGENLVLKEIQGNKMYLNPRDQGISTELLVRRIHEPAATKILKEELSEGMHVVDIGANIGYYALIEAQIVSNIGKVYAIEPELSNFELLKKNVQVNCFDNIVETFQLAIADKDGPSKLYISDASNLHSLFNLENTSEDRYIIIKTSTLDNFLRDKTRIDLIRMDIEGFEYKVIDGMIETLEKEKSLKLFIEFHPHLLKAQGWSVKPLLRKLAAFGFEPTAVVIKWRDEIIRDISMEDLIEDDYITKDTFHAFFKKDYLCKSGDRCRE